MSLTTDLLHCFELEESAGDNKLCSVGSSLYLMEDNFGESEPLGSALGKVNNGCYFPYMDPPEMEWHYRSYLTASSKFANATNFTMCMWVKVMSCIECGYCVFVTTAMDPSWINGNGISLYTEFMGTQGPTNFLIKDKTIELSADLLDGQWHHFAFTHIGTTGETVVYDNGINVGGDTTLTGIIDFASALSLTFGGVMDNPMMDGASEMMLDQICIWNRALSSNEILELYNSGDGMSYSDMSYVPPAPPINAIISIRN